MAKPAAIAHRNFDNGLVSTAIVAAAKMNQGNQSSATDGRNDCQRSDGLDALMNTNPAIDAAANAASLCQRRPRNASPVTTAITAAMTIAIPADWGVTVSSLRS